jgi:2-oxoglutarate ferredoxin oxidoreductase subunit beta
MLSLQIASDGKLPVEKLALIGSTPKFTVGDDWPFGLPAAQVHVETGGRDHHGAALVEIAQNCIIFNDATWGHITDPDKRLDHVLYLEHGKPMRFGKQGEKGIRLNGVVPEVVQVAEVGEENLLVHDERASEPTLAYLLSRMGPPDFPTPLGVYRAIDKPVYSQLLAEQVHRAQAAKAADLEALFRQGETWEIPESVNGEAR